MDFPSCTDAFCYWWTFVALFRIIKQLTDRRQTLKLQQYRRFGVVLSISLLFGVAWYFYEL